jgi:hypothetical protein
MKNKMETNPYNLKYKKVDWKEGEKQPSSYLSADQFLSYLNRKGISIDRKDNLPRWASNNQVDMIKCTRKGKYGSVPTFYKPKDSKIQEMITNQKNSNNSLTGRETLKKKRNLILKIFDNADNKSLSRTSIAKEVSKKLNCKCNRKFVRSVLMKKRSSSQLEKKLQKIR